MNIKDIILNEVKDKNWSELELARYIYIRLGELLVFDPSYMVGSTSIKNKLFYKEVDIENLESNKVVCSTWSIIYSELLNEIGINAKIVGTKHCYVTVEADGHIFEADATQGSYSDLTRIKYGDETLDFGIENVEEIDKKIGCNKGMYLKEALQMLRCEFRNATLLEENLGITKDMSIIEITKIKFEFIISLLNRVATIDKGYTDAINYLYELMDVLLKEDEYSCIEENIYYDIDGIECINLVIFRMLLQDEEVYYCLAEHEENIYSVEKIEKEKVLSYDKNYHTKLKTFYL